MQRYTSDTARSSNYRRKKKNSGTASGILLFLVVITIVVMLSMTVFFNIETVKVTGASNYTAEEIIAASGLTPESNLIRLNGEKCSNNILQKLVYIEEAEISRSFPSTLVINVTASVPEANFITDSGTLLISSGGKVLDKLPEPRAGLVSFFGTEPDYSLVPGDKFASSDELKTSSVYKLLDALKARSDEKITKVDITDNGNITYLYDNRITVEMGSINDLEYKLDFSGEIIKKKIGEKTEGVLTILSDSNRASFLDKDSLEKNAEVFSQNMAAQTEPSETEESEESETEATSIDPIME